MKTNKKGISLIVLAITIISTYDEANKVDRFPPENKMKRLKRTDKVVDFKTATLFFLVSVV